MIMIQWLASCVCSAPGMVDNYTACKVYAYIMLIGVIFYISSVQCHIIPHSYSVAIATLILHAYNYSYSYLVSA